MPHSYARRIGRCLRVPVVLGGLVMGPCFFAALPNAATAQAAADRVVQGKVELSSGDAAKGAIVYIKNGKTLEVRTYISTADGSYRYGQLRPDADSMAYANAGLSRHGPSSPNPGIRNMTASGRVA